VQCVGVHHDATIVIPSTIVCMELRGSVPFPGHVNHDAVACVVLTYVWALALATLFDDSSSRRVPP
jgi:hypothetical protein